MRCLAPFAAALLLASSASGHHSQVGVYNSDEIIEIEGVVNAISWRNPHVQFTLEVAGEAGEAVEWSIEVGSLSHLRTRGLEPGFFQVGDRIRLAGLSSRRGLPEVFARNMLLENGQEALLDIRSQPRWTGGLVQPAFDKAAAQQAAVAAEGIFRVWSTVLGDPASYPMFKGDYPLTEAAQRIRAAWNPRVNPFIGCDAKGVPAIMSTPLPMEFVRQGNDVVLRLEEHDTERLIHMTADRSARPSSYDALGFSTGRWEGSSLVVETTHIDFPYLNNEGIPQSRQIRLNERFSLSDAEDRLDYHLTITDPETFTESIELTRYLIWKPEMRVRPFECQE